MAKTTATQRFRRLCLHWLRISWVVSCQLHSPVYCINFLLDFATELNFKSPTSGKAGGLEKGAAQSRLASTIRLTTATVQSVGLPSPVLECIAVATLLRTFLAVCFACCRRCLCPNLCGDGYTYEPFLHRLPLLKHSSLAPKSAAPQSSSVSLHSFARSLSHFCL